MFATAPRTARRISCGCRTITISTLSAADLAEAQYFQPPAARPPEINDCAALIRYAYREALGTETVVHRRGGTVALKAVTEAIKKVQIGTEKRRRNRR